MEDKDLVQGALQGDQDCWDILYKTYRPIVRGLCWKILGSLDELDDMMQVIFLNLVRKLHTFRGESSFSTWFYRVASTLILLHIRHNKARKFKESVQLHFVNEDNVEKESSFLIDMRFSQDIAIDAQKIVQAIKMLPPKLRKLAIHRFILGYQHHEIAELFGINIGTSKSQSNKAKRRIKKFILSGSVRKHTYKRKYLDA